MPLVLGEGNIYGFDNIANKCFESLNSAAKSFERVEISELIRMANTVESPDKKYIDEVDSVSVEDQAVFASEFTSALSDKNNWQQRIMSLFQRFQHTNPALAWLANTLFILLLSILAGLIANSIGQAKANTKVRQAPQSTAPVIVQIDESQQVAIVGDCPYYFEIEFENAKNGEVIRGYISKRSFLPVESKEDKPDADA